MRVHRFHRLIYAFRKATRNAYVEQGISALAEAQLKQPSIRFLGKIPETAHDCRCARPRSYMLFTTFLDKEPPLRCMHCNGTVPLYRLPHPKMGEHSGLLSWKSNYQACDSLQMNCTVGERFGTRQLSDPMSSLSRSGVAVCKDIMELTGDRCTTTCTAIAPGAVRRTCAEPVLVAEAHGC